MHSSHALTLAANNSEGIKDNANLIKTLNYNYLRINQDIELEKILNTKTAINEKSIKTMKNA